MKDRKDTEKLKNALAWLYYEYNRQHNYNLRTAISPIWGMKKKTRDLDGRQMESVNFGIWMLLTTPITAPIGSLIYLSAGHTNSKRIKPIKEIMDLLDGDKFDERKFESLNHQIISTPGRSELYMQLNEVLSVIKRQMCSDYLFQFLPIANELLKIIADYAYDSQAAEEIEQKTVGLLLGQYSMCYNSLKMCPNQDSDYKLTYPPGYAPVRFCGIQRTQRESLVKTLLYLPKSPK